MSFDFFDSHPFGWSLFFYKMRKFKYINDKMLQNKPTLAEFFLYNSGKE